MTFFEIPLKIWIQNSDSARVDSTTAGSWSSPNLLRHPCHRKSSTEQCIKVYVVNLNYYFCFSSFHHRHTCTEHTVKAAEERKCDKEELPARKPPGWRWLPWTTALPTSKSSSLPPQMVHPISGLNNKLCEDDFHKITIKNFRCSAIVFSSSLSARSVANRKSFF